jgi:starch-binding outer membrane protein, SusD/RagB family
MESIENRAITARRVIGALLVGALGIGAGCDMFDVTNPGPISDDALNTEAAGPTVLVGIVADVEVAVSDAAYYAGVASTDLSHDATQGWVQNMGNGILRSEDSQYVWNPGQRARWVAEDGIRRLNQTQSNPSGSILIAAAHLWAGFANRNLGDNTCVAVFDGGPAEPNSVYYTRAATHFQEAMARSQSIGAQADSIRIAAMAGLAQARLILGDFQGAAEMAVQVPDNFLWIAHRSGSSLREQNRVWEATHLSTQATVYGTYSDSIGPNGDPRTPWFDLGQSGSGGTRPYFRQMKHSTAGSDVALAKGSEMRLIQAEARLRSGDISGAMELVNHVRSLAGVAPVAAGTVAEAWLALDRERHLVLWLEGRRLRDNVRLAEPGLSPWAAGFMAGRQGCFPPSLTEINSNPNLN